MRFLHAPFPSAPRSAVRGFALVLTLLLIFLMAVLIIAVFSTVGTETKASNASSTGQVSRQLADLAVQLVKSQLQTATTQGPSVAWASQPGMVRCYDSNGTEAKWYKLYSADKMVQKVQEAPSTVNGDLPGKDYLLPSSPDYGVFTDLNSPVLSADSSTLVYPVMDPRDAISYPRDPLSTDTSIAGFDIDFNNLPSGYKVGSTPSATNNPAAMPVRWMYVLKDGTLAAAKSTSTAGQVSIPSATQGNPVIGRVAFWTDDETSKINVNTAGDGTYFDSPRFNSAAPVKGPSGEAQRIADRQFAITPPAAQEWQRFIGHPAQTRLSYVLPGLAARDGLERSKTLSFVTPFLQWGGSKGGYVTIWDVITDKASLTMDAPKRQTPYASLDEWIFGSGALDANGQRVQHKYLDDTTNLVTNDSLNRLHFFLSSSSEAPEVNLYGQPRVSIWPIHNDYVLPNPQPQTAFFRTTALDRMTAHASSLKLTTKYAADADRYYFTRADSTSPTSDYDNITRNQQLIEYLRALGRTPEPGYGGSFNTKYQADGTNQVLTEIFDYIRSTNANDAALMSPDFRQFYNFSTPPSADRPDYSYAKYRPERFQTVNATQDYWKHPGFGQVVPIYIKPYGTKGFGRCYSISEVGLDFTVENTYPAVAPAGKTWIVGNLYLGLFSPSMAPGNLEPDIRVVVSGLENMTVSDGTTSQPIFELTNNRKVYSAIPRSARWNAGTTTYPFMWGGAAGPHELFAYKNSTFYVNNDGAKTKTPTTLSPPVARAATATVTPYGFCGKPMMVSSSGNLTVPPLNQDLTISIYFSGAHGTGVGAANTSAGEGYDGDSSSLIQTIKVKFPGFQNLPLPTNPMVTYTDKNNTKQPVDVNYRLQNAFYMPGNYQTIGPALEVINYSPTQTNHNISDTIRTLVTGYNGDMRLVAGQREVPAEGFVPHPNFGSTARFVQSFRTNAPGMDYHEPVPEQGSSIPSPFTPSGKLVTNASYPPISLPVVGFVDTNNFPSSQMPDATGDWDNGIGVMPDGPFINKPDEPNVQYFQINGEQTDYPYYTQGDMGAITTGQLYSSPNRTLASPVMFGSLSTGVPVGSAPPVPWQTLLFRPQQGHFGGSSPKDSLLLDWFWMPVVEPYAISTPMATSGKVNMNYQIAPFTYIKRATALMSVLGSEYTIAVPNSDVTTYKSAKSVSNTYRKPIKVAEADNKTAGEKTGSLRQFRETFDNNQIFKSASDICDIYLVPGNPVGSTSGAASWYSKADAETFWGQNKLTGDNTRERPYNGLYPRLTTKSNTFTVHVRAQALKAPVYNAPAVWVENPSSILSEYRGSVAINRYIDPEDTRIKDFAAYGKAPSNEGIINDTLDKYYKYRVLDTRRFLP